MRKAFIVLTGILFTLLFATCTQFTADIDDYLSRWSSEAFIQSSTIDKKTYNDANGIVNVASADKVTITLKVQNPKSFWFVMPSASETRKIVEFAHFAGAKPAAGTDYELIQPSADTLKLVYKDSFLKKAEWGEEDISSTITLYANDGRPPFKQTFTIPLKANTPPPKPGYAVAKTTGTTAYYVLCITVPDMDKTAGGGLLHKDLACIEVNGTPYTFSVDEGQHKFTKPEGPVFITHSDVEKLSNQPNDAIPTDSSWVLYYKTDVKVESGATKKDYTIRLIDKKGLASDIVNASTKPNKPEAEEITITEGTRLPGSGSGSSDTDQIIIGTDSSGAALSVSSATGNTTVHCTLTESGSSTPAKYDGNPVTVPLPLNGGSEKQYKLEYYTDGTGFAATPVKTIYYKVVKTYTVTFRVEIVDGKAGGTIEAGTNGETTAGTVSVAHGGSVTFTGRPATEDWKAAGWTVSPGSFASPPGTSTTATLSDVKEPKTVTVKFYQSTLKNPATWKDLARAVKSAPDNATLTINGEIQATDVDADKSEIDIEKNLTIKGENNAILNALGKKGIFDVYKTLTLKDITLQKSKKLYNYSGGAGVYVNSHGKFIMKGSSVITECSAENSGGGVYVGGGTFEMHDSSKITGCSADKKGGGVYVSSGTFKMQGSSTIAECSAKNSGGGVHVKDGTFKMSGSAVVTPATGSEANDKGKNDVYLESGKTITVDGTLSNNPAARITPQSYMERVVLKAGSDVTLANEVGKFTVTPPNPPMPWYIDSSGTLKAPDTVTVANGTQLRDAIQNAQVGKPLVITVTQAFSTTESFKIPNGKNITIKDDGTSRTLKCPHIQDKHKFFLVESGGKLTLQGKITLEGESNVNDEQHALYVEQGGTAEIKGNVEIKDFKNNGEACVYTNGTLIMSGGKITGNKARFGGGVFIFDDGIFEMTGGSIEYNSVVSDGSAMRIRGIFNWWGGTIQNNTINNPGPGRGALYLDGGVLNNPHNFTAG